MITSNRPNKKRPLLAVNLVGTCVTSEINTLTINSMAYCQQENLLGVMADLTKKIRYHQHKNNIQGPRHLLASN